MRKYFLITEKGCRYLLYRVNGLTRAHIKEWFGKTPEKEKEFAQENRATDKLGDITKTKAETIIPVKNLYVAKLEEDRKKNEELTEKLIQEREEGMNEIVHSIEVFKNKEFGEIRTILIENEPWFVLNDLMGILGLSNITELQKRLNKKGLSKTEVLTKGGKQNVWVVNESNLYKCIFRSNKKEALLFEEWVTSEILPSIRKHGMYATDELLDNPDLLIQVATKLKEEKEKNIFLLSENKQQEKRIKHLEPHANFSKEYLKSEDTVAQLYLTVEKCTIFSRNYG